MPAEDLKEYFIVQTRQDTRKNTIVYLAPVLGKADKIGGYDVLIYKRQVSGVVTVAHLATGLYIAQGYTEFSARINAEEVLRGNGVAEAIESSKNLLARHKIDYPVNS